MTPDALMLHIHELMKGVQDPLTGKILDVPVTDVMISPDQISFCLTIPQGKQMLFENARTQMEDFLRKKLDPLQVFVGLTAQKETTPQKTTFQKFSLPNIKSIVAVASGKGGVGKSTLTLNLAVALKSLGLRVGLLDADLHGPSLPHLLNNPGQAQVAPNKKLQPLWVGGVACMSIGFLVPEGEPIVWRGPMVQSALKQLLMEVEWPELDCLLIDLPPGTGDVHLTMIQKVPLSGAIVISTPQDLALIDARRGISLFEKTQTPLIGLVENMSSFVCPHCQGESAIFGRGGAQEEASRRGIPFLGRIPLDMAIRDACDRGVPAFIQESLAAGAREGYQNVAARVALWLEAQAGGKILI